MPFCCVAAHHRHVDLMCSSPETGQPSSAARSARCARVAATTAPPSTNGAQAFIAKGLSAVMPKAGCSSATVPLPNALRFPVSRWLCPPVGT